MLQRELVKAPEVFGAVAPARTVDTHLAMYRGTKSRVEVRQGAAENYRPELYVAGEVGPALYGKVAELERQYPGIGVEDRGGEFRVTIPDWYRVGHEAH